MRLCEVLLLTLFSFVFLLKNFCGFSFFITYVFFYTFPSSFAILENIKRFYVITIIIILSFRIYAFSLVWLFVYLQIYCNIWSNFLFIFDTFQNLFNFSFWHVSTILIFYIYAFSIFFIPYYIWHLTIFSLFFYFQKNIR